jgi:hypothetical protein
MEIEENWLWKNLAQAILNISENGEKALLCESKGLDFGSYTRNGEEIIKPEGEMLPFRHYFMSAISIYKKPILK